MSRSWTARRARADLREPGGDRSAVPPPSTNVVESAVHDHPPRGAEVLGPDVVERQPGLLGDHRAAGEGGEVAEVLDPPVAEAGRAHGDGLQRAVLVVGDEHPERAAVDLLGEDHQRPRGPS